MTRDRIAPALELAGTDQPAAARSAAAAVDVLLAGVRESAWPELAWRFSRLTANGFPFELSFSSASNALRYTCEIAGPDMPEAARVGQAQRLVQQLEPGFALPTLLAEVVRRTQADSELGWGAWVGGRHTADRDTYKLYAEVPRSGREIALEITADYLGPEPLLRHLQPRMKGVGYEAGPGLTELYYRVDGLDVWETGALLDRVGLASRQAELLDLMQEALGRSVRRALPPVGFGLSYTFGANGSCVTFSLFNYVQALFGADGKVRRQLLSLADRRGWDLNAYARVSEPMAAGDTPAALHTVVAFSVVRGRPAAVTVGLVPPTVPQ